MATREADGTVYTHAGPEIGVASTKAFTSQLVALHLLAIAIGQARGTLSTGRGAAAHPRARSAAAPHRADAEAGRSHPRSWRAQLHHHRDFLYLGRGINYPIALEGALKLKEISYIHAEGYPAGEMKHGPIALIDDDLPVVAIAADDVVFDKAISNIQEAKSRGGAGDRRHERVEAAGVRRDRWTRRRTSCSTSPTRIR